MKKETIQTIIFITCIFLAGLAMSIAGADDMRDQIAYSQHWSQP
jgi:hypothetical protein